VSSEPESGPAEVREESLPTNAGGDFVCIAGEATSRTTVSIAPDIQYDVRERSCNNDFNERAVSDDNAGTMT
jgi:hypothetical protein